MCGESNTGGCWRDGGVVQRALVCYNSLAQQICTGFALLGSRSRTRRGVVSGWDEDCERVWRFH